MIHQFLTAAEYFKKVAQTVYLYKNIWKEHTTALLHAPRETDKTSEALTIACDLAAAGRDVAYIACESRIADHADMLAAAPDSLSICVPAFESADDSTDYADLIISTIEEIAKSTSIRTFVIDSVTRIAALSFGRNASAAYVMKRLIALQMRGKLSLLVISHDTTRATERTLLTPPAETTEPADPTIDTKNHQPHPHPTPPNNNNSRKSSAPKNSSHFVNPGHRVMAGHHR